MSNTEVQQDEMTLPFATTSRQQVIQVLAASLVVGLLAWGLAFLLETYLLKGILCPGSGAMKCTAAFQYSGAIASIIAATFGLFTLVKLQVFRPLLVVLAATISLWGLVPLVSVLPGQQAVLITVLLSGIAYSLFAWIARIRLFWTAIILMLLLIVAVRFVLMA